MSRLACCSFVFAAAAACGGGGGEEPSVDAPVMPGIDAAIPIDAPPEPKPAFIVSGQMSGQLAVDDVGIRPTFKLNGQDAQSFVNLSLREEGASASCTFVIFPAFTAFGAGSPSNRTFKTITYDAATSTVLSDECHWDDAYVLGEIKVQFGLAEIGWSRARFAEDRPKLDVFFDAEVTFAGNSDSIVNVAGGSGFLMSAEGVVDTTMLVEPVGGTLDRAVYVF